MKQHVNIAIDSSFNVLTTLKKYSTVKHSLFNYWSLLFYNKYIYYFFNCFLKQGKKSIAIKLVYLLLINIKRKTMISPILVLQSALLNYRHILKLKIIQYKRKKIFSYILLSLNKQVKISIKYLAAQFASFNISTNKYSLVDRLTIFILNLFFRTPLIFGRFLQHSAQVHKLIQENKKGFKRKKKKWKFRRRRRRRKYIPKSKWKRISRLKRIYKYKRKHGQLKSLLTKSLRRRKQIKKRKKRLRILKRRIRKVLIRSIIKPLKKRRLKTKKRKNIEYKQSIRNLYLDVSNSVDLPLLEDLNVNNNFFIQSVSNPQAKSFYFYLLLGKWYKILEHTYKDMTSSFWHLYNLRSKFLRHRVYKNVLVNQVAPQIQNVYVKYLIKYLNNSKLVQKKLLRTVSSSTFITDPKLSTNLISLLDIKKKIIKKKKISVIRATKLNTKLDINSNKPSLKTYLDKPSCTRFILHKKSLRLFLRTQQFKQKKGTLNSVLRSRIIKLIRSIYIQKNIKLRRTKYVPLIHLFVRLKRIFFILIRFKLIRLVWFSLRAIELRRSRPLRLRYRKIIANKAFLIKN
jgi:ribosomal protein S7